MIRPAFQTTAYVATHPSPIGSAVPTDPRHPPILGGATQAVKRYCRPPAVRPERVATRDTHGRGSGTHTTHTGTTGEAAAQAEATTGRGVERRVVPRPTNR